MAGPVFRTMALRGAPGGEPPKPRTAIPRVVVFNTVSGRVVADAPFVGTPRWAVALNDPGTVEVDVPVGSGGVSSAWLDNYCQPWRWSWAYCYGSHILQAGPVVSERYKDGSGYTTVLCTGILGLFQAKRVLIRSTWSAGQHWEQTAGDTNLGPASLHTIAKRIVANDQARSGNALPIVLPPDIGGNSVRNYFGYDLASVGDRLLELTQVDNGPEVEFRPRFADASERWVEWEMRIGNPRLVQRGAPHAFDYGRALVTLDVDNDGSQQTFGNWTRGDGTERTTTGAYRENRFLVDNVPGDFAWPMLETVDSDHTSASDWTTLQGWADANVAANNRSRRLVSASVRIDGANGDGRATRSPSIDLVRAGDTAQFGVYGHRRIADGHYPQRIVGFGNGDSPYTVALQLQDMEQEV